MSQNLQSLFFNKVAGLRPETLAQMFSCEFREIFKSTFFTEHLRWVLLKVSLMKTLFFYMVIAISNFFVEICYKGSQFNRQFFYFVLIYIMINFNNFDFGKVFHRHHL